MDEGTKHIQEVVDTTERLQQENRLQTMIRWKFTRVHATRQLPQPRHTTIPLPPLYRYGALTGRGPPQVLYAHSRDNSSWHPEDIG